MNHERRAEARASLCGWGRCVDCQYLREALDEIERLRLAIERTGRLLEAAVLEPDG